MCYEKISKEKAIHLAEGELNRMGWKYLKNTIEAYYTPEEIPVNPHYKPKKFNIGSKRKGWTVSVELDLDKGIIDGRDIFIKVSDPDGLIDMPRVL